jgi:hypothetical protein
MISESVEDIEVQSQKGVKTIGEDYPPAQATDVKSTAAPKKNLFAVI